MKGVSFLYYTQEQIDRANQADLVLFLQSQGEPLERAGQEYRWMLITKLIANTVFKLNCTHN